MTGSAIVRVDGFHAALSRPIGWFVRHVLDAPGWRWLGLNQANAALTILQWDTYRPPTLITFNDTGHLSSD